MKKLNITLLCKDSIVEKLMDTMQATADNLRAEWLRLVAEGTRMRARLYAERRSGSNSNGISAMAAAVRALHARSENAHTVYYWYLDQMNREIDAQDE